MNFEDVFIVFDRCALFSCAINMLINDDFNTDSDIMVRNEGGSFGEHLPCFQLVLCVVLGFGTLASFIFF